MPDDMVVEQNEPEAGEIVRKKTTSGHDYWHVDNPAWQARNNQFDRLLRGTIKLAHLLGKQTVDLWPTYLNDPALYSLGQLCAMANVLEWVAAAIEGTPLRPEQPARSTTT